MTDPAAFAEAIQDEVGKVLIGNDEVIEGLTIALLTRGHVLLEGYRVSRRRLSRTSSHGRQGSSTTASK